MKIKKQLAKKIVAVQKYAKQHLVLALLSSFLVGGALISLLVISLVNGNKPSQQNSSQPDGKSSSLSVTSANTKLASDASGQDQSTTTTPSTQSSQPSSTTTKKSSSQDAPAADNTQPSSTPTQQTPTAKQPVTHAFFSGTITPELMTNQPPNGYSVWGNYSASFDVSGYNKAKVSWFIDQSADPSVEIQISYDGSSWISYKTAINSGAKTGSISFDTPASYMRIFMNNGSCVPGYCESPRPSWAQPYSATVNGYFSN